MPFDTNDVQVKLTSGRTVRIPVIAVMTTNELCQKVAEEENAPAEVITLKFGGKVLKRSKTMYEYGVREEMELKVKLLSKETLKVNLHLPGADKEVVSIDTYNTLPHSDIMNKLKGIKMDLPSQYQIKFHIGNMELKMDAYAYEDCIKDGEDIKVEYPRNVSGEELVEEELEEDERQEVLNSFASSMTSRRKVDIVFSFDTTGSMYSLLSTVRDRLRESVTKLMSDIPNIQIGLMAHGDYCDEHKYVLRKHDISSDMADLVNYVEETQGSGGEGNFACYEWVLRHANGLSWREDAAKALVIIGDVVPHPPSYTDIKVNWRDELQELCDKDVKVYGVQALDNRDANSFYGYMARKSGGAHIKFQHFSLITDMFLAVCYRESGDDQLQAYVDEVKNEGRMTEEMMDVMKQLEKKPEQEEEKEEEKKTEEAAKETGGAEAEAEAAQPSPQRPQEEEYVQAPWWDAALDTEERPKFLYDNENNFWSRNTLPSIHDHSVARSSIGRSFRKSFRRKGSKKGCLLM